METFEEFLSAILKYDLNIRRKNLDRNFKYANGCGAKGGTKFPKTMWGVNIEPACIIHDIEWHISKTYSDLVSANENFDNNLKLITDLESMNDFTRGLRRLRIAKYVSAVELIGTLNYAEERGFI